MNVGLNTDPMLTLVGGKREISTVFSAKVGSVMHLGHFQLIFRSISIAIWMSNYFVSKKQESILPSKLK